MTGYRPVQGHSAAGSEIELWRTMTTAGILGQ